MLASESCAAASRNSSGTGRSGVRSVDSITAAASASRLRRRDLRMRVFRGDHFALLRHADLAVHGACRLGEDRLVARAAAAPDRAAAAMEQAEPDAALLLEEFRKRDGSAINLPVAREKAAVLVAVASSRA